MSKSEEKKLFDAMKEDDAVIQTATDRLISFANRKFVIIIKDPNNPKDSVPVRSRALKDNEVSTYTKKLRNINLELLKSDPNESKITPEQNDKVRDLMDEYIELATGISLKDLKQIGSDKIRASIFTQIMKISVPSKEEIEGLQKFRPAP